MRRLSFVPPLSKRKCRTIWALGYNLETKILSQDPYRRFWLLDGVLGDDPMAFPARGVVCPLRPFHGESAIQAGRAIHERSVRA